MFVILLLYTHTCITRRAKMDNEDEEMLLDYGAMTFNAHGGFMPAPQEDIEWVSPDLGVIE